MQQLDQYQPPGDATQPQKLFPLQFIGGLRADLSNPWLIKGILPKTGLAVLYGSPGSGKSFAALDMTLRIASGQPFAGCKTKRGGVVYISAEAGLGFKKRVIAARDAMQLPDDTPFAMVAVAPDLGKADGDTEPLMNQIYSQADRANLWPDVIVIDTAARVIPGLDENSSRDMGMLVRNCDAIAKNFEGLVILVHHSGKVAESGMRGSSALLGAADCVIGISSDETGLRTARLEKQKDGEDGQSFTFRLKSVTLGNDEDGDAVSTCIVSDVTDLSRAEPQKRKSGPAVPASLRQWLEIFDQTIADAGKMARPFLDGPEVRTIDRETLRQAFYARRGDETPEAKRQAFKRGLDQASSRQDILATDHDGKALLWRA